ncbi:MAG: 2-oxo-hept-3-ene,7-dioate hydratase, partial [Acetobacteraceae bacterium]|nr:2-oxo-hept-3-ene,7-dioate hydratase [Acetobacteraceae bacterium]
MTPDQIADTAERLDTAESTRAQIRMLSLDYPGMTMDDAYAVQSAWMSRKFADGRRQIGWKIGLTSKAMQYALNIDIPDSGVLLDDMTFDDGATIPPDRFIQPRIEAEIAFILKAPLGGAEVSMFDVL